MTRFKAAKLAAEEYFSTQGKLGQDLVMVYNGNSYISEYTLTFSHDGWTPWRKIDPDEHPSEDALVFDGSTMKGVANHYTGKGTLKAKVRSKFSEAKYLAEGANNQQYGKDKIHRDTVLHYHGKTHVMVCGMSPGGGSVWATGWSRLLDDGHTLSTYPHVKFYDPNPDFHSHPVEITVKGSDLN